MSNVIRGRTNDQSGLAPSASRPASTAQFTGLNVATVEIQPGSGSFSGWDLTLADPARADFNISWSPLRAVGYAPRRPSLVVSMSEQLIRDIENHPNVPAGLFDPAHLHRPVRLPRPAAVLGEGLLPTSGRRADIRPDEADEDRAALE
jgi:hypothetical protein